MLSLIRKREFVNGVVYLLKTKDGYLIETTDTFLPYYTKDAINRNTNVLTSNNLGSRKERFIVGISTESGCSIHCKFCSTGKLHKYRSLTKQEMLDQINFVLNQNTIEPWQAREFKINYTRMGEPFLNIDNVKDVISEVETKINPNTHHYLSTIGIKGSDFSWIKDNITLQISLHSLDEERRNNLIPYKNKMTIEELGKIRTKSNLKTTVNLTLVDNADFDINKLKAYFDPNYFFIKLSPINKNEISEKNHMGNGIIQGKNII